MKTSLLYASPFPPQKSGISTYSDLLVRGLGEFFNLTLLVHECEIDPKQYPGVRILRYADPIPWDTFDHKLYNIGNNPWYHAYIYEACLRHPGTVILHESVLYFLYVGYYQTRDSFYQQVFEQEGALGVAMLKAAKKAGNDLLQFKTPELLPFNRELFHSGNSFLTHSQICVNAVRTRAGRPVRVQQINMPVEPPPSPEMGRRRLLRRLGLPENTLLAASFGFIAPTKQNHIVCEAVNRVNRTGKGPVLYLMVGEGGYVDSYLGDTIRKTGFVSDALYEDYLASVDLVVNLRYPSMGETSLALLRAMSFGKPCVVSDDGWFSELRENTVLKLEARPGEMLREMLCEVFDLCLTRPEALAQIGHNARHYIQSDFSLGRVSEQIAQFLLKPAKAVESGLHAARASA
ncbi:MAG TPA: glycosyltransferase family 4 protein [Bryobacteraceae bacterium]|jgi:glycosyltransferase involved in cell wall biosynthesis|nr:glycosyltransferase family 4 protein [Bryobacteraceae bacterium]